MKRYRPHILVLCVLAVVSLSGLYSLLQNALTDMRFRLFPRQATGAIVLVAIDSPSIDKIGIWPWPRQLHGQLIDRLMQAGATDIVFDVDFSSASNAAADRAFMEALQRAGGSVVLPAFMQGVADGKRGRSIHVNQPLPQFAKHAWSAVVNVALEPDGLVRRYSYGETIEGTFLPSVGALLAGKYATKQGPLWIDFGIAVDSIPTVSFVDVLRGDPDALNKLKGKKVIIGATAVELGDRFNVPNGAVISGPALQILAAESIVQGRALHGASIFAALACIGVLVLLMIVLWPRTSAGARTVVLVTLAIAVEAGAAYLQAVSPVIWNTAFIQITIAAYLAALALDEIDFLDLLSNVAEKRFHQIAMSLGDGLVCTDQRGLITVWNPGAAAIFGYSAEEMIGQPFSRIGVTHGVGTDRGHEPIAALTSGMLQGPGGHIVELEGRRKNGDIFPLEACFSEWQGVDGVQCGAVMRDISVRKREAEKIRYLAEHDTLTGLANRNRLQQHLEAALSTSNSKMCEVAFLLLDIDKFKQINDTLGHACGDQLLCSVAARLENLVAGTGLVARLGGDEFAIVISDAHVADRTHELLQQILLAFKTTAFAAGKRELRVNTSIGVAIYPKDCATVEELFGNADLALYHAKARGPGQFAFFESSIREKLEQRLSLEADLERALERNEFELYYQPQVNLKDGRLAGAEALIRWRSPDRGLMLPDEFMPVVNAASFSNRVALWVMRSACRQGAAWLRDGYEIRIGVNLSPSQFQSGDLSATVASVLADTGLPASLLELEVTENILLEDHERALETFVRIQALGVHLAFDDFGTGYASLAYLKRFPLDRLKIDKSFIHKLAPDTDDMAIVGAAISLGQKFGLSITAEGVEERATAELLLENGCEEGQGYYFGRPMPAAEFGQRFLSKDALPETGGFAPKSSAAA